MAAPVGRGSVITGNYSVAIPYPGDIMTDRPAPMALCPMTSIVFGLDDAPTW